MTIPTLNLLEDDEVIQSFSGVDYSVVGYIPKYREILKTNIEGELEEAETESSDENGDMFFHNMASLQTLSISTTRDHKAARVLGSSWAFDFGRGSRTVAGSLVFAMVNGDSFNDFRDATHTYVAQSKEDGYLYYADAIPPFNVIIRASNESGASLFGLLVGVRLTNTGMSAGIHDIYTEQVYSFVAERVEPLTRSIDRQTALGRFTEDLEDGENSLNKDRVEAIIKRTYGQSAWKRPRLAAVDNTTRGVATVATPIVTMQGGRPIITNMSRDYVSPSVRRQFYRRGREE